MNNIQNHYPIAIIGGGITGLSLAAELEKEGKSFILLEAKDRLGGQIKTLKENGFTYEVGPNTGTVSSPEVAELFEYAAPDALLEEACANANDRWIWKGDRFHSIPNGPWSGLTTPLYSLKDKLGLPFEPFRKKGTNPNETVGELHIRIITGIPLFFTNQPYLVKTAL